MPPGFRQALADHGYTLDAESGEIRQLAPYGPAFSARASQIGRNIDGYEAAWRTDHPARSLGASSSEPGTAAPGPKRVLTR